MKTSDILKAIHFISCAQNLFGVKEIAKRASIDEYFVGIADDYPDIISYINQLDTPARYNFVVCLQNMLDSHFQALYSSSNPNQTK